MTKEEMQLLKSRIDRGTVKIFCIDGEEIIAKILSVSKDEKDVIFDIVSTNRQKKYTNRQGAYMCHFDEIRSVTE